MAYYDNENGELPRQDGAQPNISFNVRRGSRTGSGVAVLSALCIMLLLIVAAAVTFVLVQGVSIVEGSDGRSIVIGGNRANGGQSPFDTSSTETDASSQSGSGSAWLNIESPPASGTEQVSKTGKLAGREVAALVKPSVVTVTTQNRYYGTAFGSGAIISEDGYIATNNHVVEDAMPGTITVILENGDTYTAEVIGTDPQTDLALLKIDAKDLPAVTLGDSEEMQVGDSVYAIGTPYSLDMSGTTTLGIISAINREIMYNGYTFTLLQTDASINSGNSGGPLVNEYGQVIGINSMKIANDFEGLGFAIPTSIAKPILEELKQFGKITRPSIGISGRYISGSQNNYYSIPDGIYLEQIDPRSDAYIKGLKQGDIIVKIDGRDFASTADFDKIKFQKKVGESVILTVYRDDNLYDKVPGQTFDVEIFLVASN